MAASGLGVSEAFHVDLAAGAVVSITICLCPDVRPVEVACDILDCFAYSKMSSII